MGYKETRKKNGSLHAAVKNHFADVTLEVIAHSPAVIKETYSIYKGEANAFFVSPIYDTKTTTSGRVINAPYSFKYRDCKIIGDKIEVYESKNRRVTFAARDLTEQSKKQIEVIKQYFQAIK